MSEEGILSADAVDAVAKATSAAPVAPIAHSLHDIAPGDLERAFGNDGKLAKALPGWRQRPQQVEMATHIANAIRNATGVRMFELPFTPEKVYRALHGLTPKLYWKPWRVE